MARRRRQGRRARARGGAALPADLPGVRAEPALARGQRAAGHRRRQAHRHALRRPGAAARRATPRAPCRPACRQAPAHGALGAQPPPHIDPVGAADVGVKTRTQLLAERNVLRSLLATAIAGAGDPALRPAASDFASGICRHFALLFAAGARAPAAASPLRGKPLGAASPGALPGRARAAGLQELDPNTFLDALVDVRPAARAPRRPPPCPRDDGRRLAAGALPAEGRRTAPPLLSGRCLVVMMRSQGGAVTGARRRAGAVGGGRGAVCGGPGRPGDLHHHAAAADRGAGGRVARQPGG